MWFGKKNRKWLVDRRNVGGGKTTRERELAVGKDLTGKGITLLGQKHRAEKQALTAKLTGFSR